MLDRLFNYNLHKYLHVLGAAILVVGLPFNKVLMSIGTIWLVANVLLEGNFKEYWEKLKINPIFWVIFGLTIFHFIGLLWSEDLAYGLRDIRTKLPFFVLPAVFIAKPLDNAYWKPILYLFVFTLAFISLTNYTIYFLIEQKDYSNDIRELSFFSSHIRFGILVVFGAVLAAFQVVQNKKWILIWILLLFWFLYYTLIAQVMTAYFTLFILTIGVIIAFILQLKKWYYQVLIISIFALFSGFLINKLVVYLTPDTAPIEVSKLDRYSSSGNIYLHIPENELLENGHHIYTYICHEELAPLWNEISTINYDSLDNRKQPLKATLIRYMTSKGLRKDADGFKSLTDKDIKNIEKGIPSINATQNSYLSRLDGLKMQIYSYQMGTSPSGHSLLQRFEHWKTALFIIRENFWFGVGTGDVQNEFDIAYEELNSPLEKHYWNRSHNQFLTFWVSFGILGFCLFLSLWILLFKYATKNKNWLAYCFALIVVASFIPEDTLETQQGVTFVAFFIGFLPFVKYVDKKN